MRKCSYETRRITLLKLKHRNRYHRLRSIRSPGELGMPFLESSKGLSRILDDVDDGLLELGSRLPLMDPRRAQSEIVRRAIEAASACGCLADP